MKSRFTVERSASPLARSNDFVVHGPGCPPTVLRLVSDLDAAELRDLLEKAFAAGRDAKAEEIRRVIGVSE